MVVVAAVVVGGGSEYGCGWGAAMSSRDSLVHMNCVKFMVVEVVAVMVVEVEGLDTRLGVWGWCIPRGEEKTMGEIAVSTPPPRLGAAASASAAKEGGVALPVAVMVDTPASAVVAAAVWNAPGESGEVMAPVEV